MDAKEIEKWIEHHAVDAAAWNARRKGRKKKWKVDKAREAVKPAPPKLATHARRKHQQNNNKGDKCRESMRDNLEKKTEEDTFNNDG
jgi:hypothetical protein